MKGIILAGGSGSRLYPLTKVTNKCLLPVGNQPMIVHPLKTLLSAGITEIMVITGIDHAGHMIATLGSGSEYNCEITYKVQDSANGIAAALKLCEDLVNNDTCAVILGDTIIEDDLSNLIKDFSGYGCKLFLKEIDDPERFGVATIKNGVIVKLVEKPKNPETNLAVIGLYLYDNKVFKVIDRLKPSARGELEITDVNDAYVYHDDVEYNILKGLWLDAGVFKSYIKANNFVFEREFNE